MRLHRERERVYFKDNLIIIIIMMMMMMMMIIIIIIIKPLGRSLNSVFLYFIEVPQVSISSVKPSYREGSSVNISCTASGTPEPDVKWIRNGIVQSLGKKTAFLTLRSVSKADDGQYTCRANNSAGNKERHVTLTVHCKYYCFSVFDVYL